MISLPSLLPSVESLCVHIRVLAGNQTLVLDMLDKCFTASSALPPPPHRARSGSLLELLSSVTCPFSWVTWERWESTYGRTWKGAGQSTLPGGPCRNSIPSHSLQVMSEESACAVAVSFPNTWVLAFVMQGLGLAFLPMLLPAEVGMMVWFRKTNCLQRVSWVGITC